MGKCCKWCGRLVGTYDYATVRNTGNDVFRRHKYCRCTVEFITNGKRQNVHTKKWNRQNDLAEKERSKKKNTNENTIINKLLINKPEYRKKFTSITKENKISRSLWRSALEMLEHRSGTKYEDIVFVDSKTGKTLINKNYNKEKETGPNEKMKKMLKKAEPYSIIGIHNHPESFAPSFADLVVCKNLLRKVNSFLLSF